MGSKEDKQASRAATRMFEKYDYTVLDSASKHASQQPDNRNDVDTSATELTSPNDRSSLSKNQKKRLSRKTKKNAEKAAEAADQKALDDAMARNSTCPNTSPKSSSRPSSSNKKSPPRKKGNSSPSTTKSSSPEPETPANNTQKLNNNPNNKTDLIKVETSASTPPSTTKKPSAYPSITVKEVVDIPANQLARLAALNKMQKLKVNEEVTPSPTTKPKHSPPKQSPGVIVSPDSNRVKNKPHNSVKVERVNHNDDSALLKLKAKYMEKQKQNMFASNGNAVDGGKDSDDDELFQDLKTPEDSDEDDKLPELATPRGSLKKSCSTANESSAIQTPPEKETPHEYNDIEMLDADEDDAFAKADTDTSATSLEMPSQPINQDSNTQPVVVETLEYSTISPTAPSQSMDDLSHASNNHIKLGSLSENQSPSHAHENDGEEIALSETSTVVWDLPSPPEVSTAAATVDLESPGMDNLSMQSKSSQDLVAQQEVNNPSSDDTTNFGTSTEDMKLSYQSDDIIDNADTSLEGTDTSLVDDELKHNDIILQTLVAWEQPSTGLDKMTERDEGIAEPQQYVMDGFSRDNYKPCTLAHATVPAEDHVDNNNTEDVYDTPVTPLGLLLLQNGQQFPFPLPVSKVYELIAMHIVPLSEISSPNKNGKNSSAKKNKIFQKEPIEPSAVTENSKTQVGTTMFELTDTPIKSEPDVAPQEDTTVAEYTSEEPNMEPTETAVNAQEDQIGKQTHAQLPPFQQVIQDFNAPARTWHAVQEAAFNKAMSTAIMSSSIAAHLDRKAQQQDGVVTTPNTPTTPTTPTTSTTSAPFTESHFTPAMSDCDSNSSDNPIRGTFTTLRLTPEPSTPFNSSSQLSPPVLSSAVSTPVYKASYMAQNTFLGFASLEDLLGKFDADSNDNISKGAIRKAFAALSVEEHALMNFPIAFSPTDGLDSPIMQCRVKVGNTSLHTFLGAIEFDDEDKTSVDKISRAFSHCCQNQRLHLSPKVARLLKLDQQATGNQATGN